MGLAPGSHKHRARRTDLRTLFLSWTKGVFCVYVQGRLNCRLRAGLMCVLHRKALLAGNAVDQQKHQESPVSAAGCDDSRSSGIHWEVQAVRGPTANPGSSGMKSGSKGVRAESTGGSEHANSSGCAARDAGSSSSGSGKSGKSVAFEVQTLMSVDVGRVLNLGPSLNEAWSLPLQVAVALYLLYTQVGPIDVLVSACLGWVGDSSKAHSAKVQLIPRRS